MRQLLCVDSEDRDKTTYPSASKHQIAFPLISNVQSVKLLSSIFHHTATVIDSSNNKLCWQNESGEKHSVSIPEGNYTYHTLVATLMNALNSVPTESQMHYFKIETNRVTNAISFVQFTSPSFVSMTYNGTTGRGRVNVFHVAHGLRNDDEIYISNIDAKLLDLTNVITGNQRVRVTGPDHYDLLIIPSHLRSTKSADITGQAKVQTRVPFQFVDEENSMLDLLGLASSVVNTVHTNAGGKVMNLAGCDYYFLKCPQLSCAVTSSGETGVFAKLHLDGPAGSIIFNSFTSIDKHFDEAVSLDCLDIEIVKPNGVQVSSRDSNHSFVFEVTHQRDPSEIEDAEDDRL